MLRTGVTPQKGKQILIDIRVALRSEAMVTACNSSIINQRLVLRFRLMDAHGLVSIRLVLGKNRQFASYKLWFRGKLHIIICC